MSKEGKETKLCVFQLRCISVISLAMRNILPKTEHATSFVHDMKIISTYCRLYDSAAIFFPTTRIWAHFLSLVGVSDEWWWHAQAHVSTSILKHRFIVCLWVLGVWEWLLAQWNNMQKMKRKKNLQIQSPKAPPNNDRIRRHWYMHA